MWKISKRVWVKMIVICDCGHIFDEMSLVFVEDGSVNFNCPNCGDCKEWF